MLNQIKFCIFTATTSHFAISTFLMFSVLVALKSRSAKLQNGVRSMVQITP
jgi:hypothetical protein